MAKFYGIIGFTETKETSPDVWTDQIVERPYRGDVLRNIRRWEASDQVNDNLNVQNQISIVYDAYAAQNFFAMKYIIWMGTAWKITSVEVKPPRLLLTIGGVYNGERQEIGTE